MILLKFEDDEYGWRFKDDEYGCSKTRFPTLAEYHQAVDNAQRFALIATRDRGKSFAKRCRIILRIPFVLRSSQCIFACHRRIERINWMVN